MSHVWSFMAVSLPTFLLSCAALNRFNMINKWIVLVIYCLLENMEYDTSLQQDSPVKGGPV